MVQIWSRMVTVKIVCQLIEKDFDDVMELIIRKPKMARLVESILENDYKQASLKNGKRNAMKYRVLQNRYNL